MANNDNDVIALTPGSTPGMKPEPAPPSLVDLARDVAFLKRRLHEVHRLLHSVAGHPMPAASDYD